MGSFFRIRLYFSTGIAGFLITLASVATHHILSLNKNTQMTIMGVAFLLMGAALVFGHLYYKTHQENVLGKIKKWRQRLGVWE